jgi:RimJ/RimL family protein N-acetyltransferase
MPVVNPNFSLPKMVRIKPKTPPAVRRRITFRIDSRSQAQPFGPWHRFEPYRPDQKPVDVIGFVPIYDKILTTMVYQFT